jgi:hypothetical protein
VAISESVRLQQVLATYGIQTQTPKQVEPLLVWPPAELVKVIRISQSISNEHHCRFYLVLGLR